MISEVHINEVANTKNDDRVGNVVFVHGLNGDSRATWEGPFAESADETISRDTPPNSVIFWPEWLGRELPNVGIWSLGYPAYSSRWRGEAMALPDRAKNVLELFRLKRFSAYPLVFIVHSLGGLLVKTLLRSSLTSANKEWEAIGRSVRGILFLATPHGGSLLASIHNVFRVVARSNETIADLRHHSPYLEELNDWFAGNFQLLGIKGHVLREGKATSGVFVVDKLSSRPGIPSIPVIETDADHITICKPTSPDSLIYQTTLDFVRSCLIEAPARTPDKASTADPIGCLIHVGTVRSPQSWTLLAEVRFTVTNTTARKIHLSSLGLEVLQAAPLDRTMATTTAGPVDETVLFARINEFTKKVNVLPRPHVIDPSGTDGFFLKIEAEEGFSYRLRIEAEWQFLGDDSQTSESKEFAIEVPAHSVDGLLRLAARLPGSEGE